MPPETPVIDTIYALASGAVRAGVSVVRVSGPKAINIYHTLTKKEVAPTPRQATFSSLYDPESGKLLDKALCLYFKAPHSFTGDDVLEIHIHGSVAILERLYCILDITPNVRMAEAGEFSKRAYLNGKIDLTEAEAINDLVMAETQAQAEQALAQMSGSLRNLYELWREKLVRAMAYIEADIDFSDEEIPESLSVRMKPVLYEIQKEIEGHLDDKNKGEILRSGFKVAIIGAPNVGKSSLVNRLARRDIAIVSDIAGTTRDAIECHININGFPVILTDTAGLRETNDSIEKMGIIRTRQSIESADLKLAVFDATNAPDFDDDTLGMVDANTLCFVNKTDATDRASFDSLTLQKSAGVLSGSALKQTGLDVLVNGLSDIIQRRFNMNDRPAPTRARHRQALEEARDFLIRAQQSIETELVAEDTRMAMRAIGRVTGRVDVEDLLDVIFKDFCIGK